MPLATSLQGLRVIECAGWDAVYAGRLLADAGADVVRVVPPTGDPLDREGPFLGDTDVSIQGTWYNAGKRIVALDLATGDGRAALRELVAAADILLEDWRPGAEPLAAEELAAANPRLVRVSVTPAGRDAAEQWVTNDLVANALSGSASVTGDRDTPPLTGWGNQTHHTVGFYVAISALAALHAARATGVAQHVDLSSHEALVSCTEQVLMEWFFPGTWGPAQTVAPRQGPLHWTGAYSIYPGKNGQGAQVTVALRPDTVIGWMAGEGMAGELLDAERFPDVIALIKELPLVMDTVRQWIATKDPVQFFFDAQERRLPFGVVLDVPDAMASPQIAAREFVREVEVPGAGMVPMPGRSVGNEPGTPHLPAPVRVAVRDLGWEPRAAAGGDASPATPHRPLAGIRVLDFTHVLAGPFGTRVLGDLGAEVIKINTAARAGGANSPVHPYYVMWNRSKRGVNVNVALPEGLAVARRLAERSDVISENFSAGVLRKWGLDRTSMAAANPGLTTVSMGGMGQTGPWRSFLTFAPTIHALVGLTHLTNPPGESLLGYGFSLTDHLSGLAGALAALEGVEHRRRTGEGLEIDLSQYELGLGIMAPTLIDYLANGTKHEPVGNRHPFGTWAPHGIYRAAGEDHWVAIAARGDAQFAALCRTMGREELAADARFATHDARLANQDALDAAVEDWTRTRDRYAVMAVCQAAGVPAGAVQRAPDLVEHDPNTRHRRLFTTYNEAGIYGDYGADQYPALVNGARPSAAFGVRQPGEDTFDVLASVLGMGDEEIAGLMAAGALS
ncbi:MAG: CoA transferase [Dehalococcoidia bacterium]|nr:CoA transferase [Dehalococcoidia bacterium]